MGGSDFTRRVTGGNGFFLNRQNWFAGGAIQYEKKALFRVLYHGRNFLAVACSNVSEHRRRIKVPVINVVMGGLEIPFQLSRLCIDSDETCGVKIIAGTRRTIILVCMSRFRSP